MKPAARLLALLAGLALLLALWVWVRPVPPPTDLPPIAGMADRVVVEKSARRLMLLQDGQILREYRIALGFAPTGAKTRQGDGRTPEGIFRIDRRNDRSSYHLSLGLDYPQDKDRRRARAGGYDPGGDIMIHGQPNSLPDGVMVKGDWTAGCIAVPNAEMREVWSVTDMNTTVEIRP